MVSVCHKVNLPFLGDIRPSTLISLRKCIIAFLGTCRETKKGCRLICRAPMDDGVTLRPSRIAITGCPYGPCFMAVTHRAGPVRLVRSTLSSQYSGALCVLEHQSEAEPGGQDVKALQLCSVIH